jgi:hypothetical protein
MADSDSKACRVCGQSLPPSSFYRNKTYADGVGSICRACHNKRCSDRYHLTKVLRPQSPIGICAHCGEEFQRVITNPPRSTTKHCSIECRFWSKVDKSSGPDACWTWTSKARSNDGKGYGAFNSGSGSVRAHRFAWELTNGPIPDGLHVCHECDNPLCCNPAHFFLGTPKDNNADMISKGRQWVVTPEHIERLRAMKIGKPRSPEVREKLRQASLKNAALLSAMNVGRKRSEATKQKLREAWVRRKQRAAELALT